MSAGGVFIDDIVFPDGRTEMGVLGGASSHAAAGMILWDERAGIIACVGSGFPPDAWARLARLFDLQGVVALDIPQARSWQLFEWDGRRTEVFRVRTIEPFVRDPQPEQLPESLRSASGIHLLRIGADVPGWRAVYPDACLLWEPQQVYMSAANADDFRSRLPLVDAVSPNIVEARAVYGFHDPERLVRQMLADGAPLVALRMGERGSLLAARDHADLIAIPAVPVPEIIDQTGAGNTYCGGFLAGWLQTGSLKTAGAYGAVAASFALETIGVADIEAPDTLEKRDARLQWLLERL